MQWSACRSLCATQRFLTPAWRLSDSYVTVQNMSQKGHRWEQLSCVCFRDIKALHYIVSSEIMMQHKLLCPCADPEGIYQWRHECCPRWSGVGSWLVSHSIWALLYHQPLQAGCPNQVEKQLKPFSHHDVSFKTPLVLYLPLFIAKTRDMNRNTIKEILCIKLKHGWIKTLQMKMWSLSPHRHADGKLGELFYLQKNFFGSFPVKECYSLFGEFLSQGFWLYKAILLWLVCCFFLSFKRIP